MKYLLLFAGLSVVLTSRGMSQEQDEPALSEETKGCVFSFDSPWHVDRDVWYEDGYAIHSREMPNGGVNWFEIELPADRTSFTFWCKVVGGVESRVQSELAVDGPQSIIINTSGDGASEWREVTLAFDKGWRHKIRWTYTVGEHLNSEEEFGAWVRFEELDGYVVGRKTTSVQVICDGSGLSKIKESANAEPGVSFQTEEDNLWLIDGEVGYGDNTSLRSAHEIGNGLTSTMSIVVQGEGTLSLVWMGAVLGCFEYRVDDQDVVSFEGGSSYWTDFVVDLIGDRRHVVTLTYRAPDCDNYCDDGVWVDEVCWYAPNGWDDPNEVKRPMSVMTSTFVDLRPSPRKPSETEMIVYDASWANATEAVITFNGTEVVRGSSGIYEWSTVNLMPGTNEFVYSAGNLTYRTKFVIKGVEVVEVGKEIEFTFDVGSSVQKTFLIPGEWLVSKKIADSGDALESVAAKLTAVGGNGIPRYQSYLFGFDPNAEIPAEKQLKINIDGFDENGVPKIVFTPNESAKGYVQYTTLGKISLEGSSQWAPVTDANRQEMKFFKVRVEIK